VFQRSTHRNLCRNGGGRALVGPKAVEGRVRRTFSGTCRFDKERGSVVKVHEKLGLYSAWFSATVTWQGEQRGDDHPRANLGPISFGPAPRVARSPKSRQADPIPDRIRFSPSIVCRSYMQAGRKSDRDAACRSLSERGNLDRLGLLRGAWRHLLGARERKGDAAGFVSNPPLEANLKDGWARTSKVTGRVGRKEKKRSGDSFGSPNRYVTFWAEAPSRHGTPWPDGEACIPGVDRRRRPERAPRNW